MLELEELHLSGIGRFVEEQCVYFSRLRNFTQLDAENRNTGGSSGSGKSTTVNAIDYLFGVNDLPATILQTRAAISDDSSIDVLGKFNLDGKILEIQRASGKLSVSVDGKVTKGNNALAEEALDKIIGMPRDLFRKTYHKRQREGGFFLDFTPKKMHEFLADCQNLGIYKKKQEEVDLKIDSLTKIIAKIRNDIESNNMGLKATQDAILALGLPPIKEVSREVILEIKEKVDRSTVRLKDVSSKCEQEIRELAGRRPSIDVLRYDANTRDSLEERRKEIETAIGSCQKEEIQRQGQVRQIISEKSLNRSQIVAEINAGSNAKREAAKIAAEIKQIRSSTCPTCEQSWGNELSKTTEEKKLAELMDLKKVMAKADAAAELKVEIDQEIAALQIELTPRINPNEPTLKAELVEVAQAIQDEKRKADDFNSKQNADNKVLSDAFALEQAALQSRASAEINQVRGQLDIEQRTLDAAVGKLKSYEEARVRYENSKISLAEKEEKFTQVIVDLQSQLTKNATSLVLEEKFKKAIKTYIAYSFEDALDDIGEGATKIIRCIPNMSSATIQFEGTKENKDGKVKDEVNAVISMDGETGVPIKSLSGGERSAVDLAVDLAVINFIELKTGKGINIFFLDEPFMGLGTVEIEMALEVLKNSNTKKKLIIVDHNPEVKQMVESRLVVIREGLTSTIVQS